MSASTKIVAAVLVALALLLGVMALFVGRRPAPAGEEGAAPAVQVQTFPVVVASRELNAGDVIAGSAVRVVQMPVQPQGAYSRIQDVIGHTPRVGVAKGIPLTESGLNQGLPLSLKAGERGVAIAVDEVTGAGNSVQAGDYVDVFIIVKAADAPTGVPGTDRMVARLLLSRLRVLSYGTDSLVPSTAQPTEISSRDAQRQQARSAVLAVPVADVDKLVLASQTGHLTLALRYPEDLQVPNPALFELPPPVLTPRSGLDASAREAVNSPVNTAFAGADSPALVGVASGGTRANTVPTLPTPLPANMMNSPGPTSVATAAAAARSTGERMVEVIRGSDFKRESVDEAGSSSNAPSVRAQSGAAQ